MSYDEAPGGIDLTDKQKESIMIGGTVEATMGDREIDISLKSMKMSLTPVQARLIVEALSRGDYEDDIETSVARRTQTQIRDQFDVD